MANRERLVDLRYMADRLSDLEKVELAARETASWHSDLLARAFELFADEIRQLQE